MDNLRTDNMQELGLYWRHPSHYRSEGARARLFPTLQGLLQISPVTPPPPDARVLLPPSPFSVLGLGGSWYCQGHVGIWPGTLDLRVAQSLGHLTL